MKMPAAMCLGVVPQHADVANFFAERWPGGRPSTVRRQLDPITAIWDSDFLSAHGGGNDDRLGLSCSGRANSVMSTAITEGWKPWGDPVEILQI